MPTPNFFTRKPLAAALRMLIVAATLSVSAAHADDYTDVSRLMRAGQFAEAMTKVDQYLATKPRDPQMRFFKGVIQTETGKTNDAIATFTKITEDYPELPEPYNNMAVLYAGQSQFDKARAALEMAIRTNPSYATAHENLGDVYARLASQAYSKALQLDGGNAAVPPKLALIRNLFSADPQGAGQPQPQAAAKPATGAQASGQVTAAAPAPPQTAARLRPLPPQRRPRHLPRRQRPLRTLQRHPAPTRTLKPPCATGPRPGPART
jgi:tetratricopeptide (TPR) repeat protein